MSGSVAEGGCLCGKVRFRACGEPIFTAYCHCRDCRRASGAPVTAFVGYPVERVEWIGERKAYRSSPDVVRSFCGECGASLTYEDAKLPGEVYLAVGVFDEPEEFEPATHSWESRRLGWLDIRDELPRFEQSSKPR